MINIGSIVRIKHNKLNSNVMRHEMETPHGVVIDVVETKDFRLCVIKYLDTGEVSSYFDSHLEEL
jgi:hypothetical protein